MTTSKIVPKRKTAKMSFGQDLSEAMQEVVAIERGKATPARVIKVPLTARKTTAAPAPDFDTAQVRTKPELAQPVFAKALNGVR